MDAITAAAYAAFRRRLDPGSPGPVALALSGGGDSLALLHVAAGWCARAGRPLLALTVDHGLHADSAAWTRAAGEASACVGVDWRPLSWEGLKPQAGVAAAARTARHGLLADAARDAGAKVLLTGHTLDDMLEAELMRAADVPSLGRLREWSPSPAWPEGRGLFLLRPLLDQRRWVLRTWLRERGLAWLDDPANEDLRYARPRARARLHPPKDAAGAERSDEGYDPVVASHPVISPGPAAFPRPPAGTPDGRIVLPRRELSARLLAAALLCAAGTDRPPRGEPLARLLARLLAEGGPVRATLAGGRIVADMQTVQIGRDPGRGGLPSAPLAPRGPLAWDGRFEITADEAGWSVAPLAGLMARLPAEDRRRLQGVPAWARGALPALVRADGAARLPRPFADGPADALALGTFRLAAACGLIAREGQITGG